MKKDDLLISYSIVTPMNRNDHISEDGKYMKLSDEIEKAIENVAVKYGQDIEHYSETTYVISTHDAYDGKPDNAGRCIRCNKWVSAQNKPNIIIGLGVGAEYESNLYCQQHLPKESPVYKKLFPVWEREEEESLANH
jgi:hypothetical protein